MYAEKEALKVTTAFFDRETKKLSLYVDGLGGFFVRRAKDGMIIGYKDKRRHMGKDDHVTIFFDKNGVKGLHRTVSDSENEIYLRYNLDYFSSQDGIRNLTQDLQREKNVRFTQKALLMVLYRILELTYHKKFKNARVLTKSEADGLGMESPCIYTRSAFADRALFTQFGNFAPLLGRAHRRRFGKKPTEGFAEMSIPGSQITRRKKNRNSGSNS